MTLYTMSAQLQRGKDKLKYLTPIVKDHIKLKWHQIESLLKFYIPSKTSHCLNFIFKMTSYKVHPDRIFSSPSLLVCMINTSLQPSQLFCNPLSAKEIQTS